jgi:methionine-R-sulfoxide reductase
MELEQFNGTKLVLPEKEWKKRLSDEQYHVLREEGTECAFQNAFFEQTKEGVYACAGCGLPLFRSGAKFYSHSGWPSFWEPVFPENVSYRTDRKLGMTRTEVRCSRCDGHLGHIFDDGPLPTGKRYCMNSEAMTFIPSTQA